jgi:hypothetical protein
MTPTLPQPLSLAATVLNPSTLEAVRLSPSFHLRAWKILDRWALNSPSRLLALQAQGELILLERLLQQQEMEHQVLTAALSHSLIGLAEHEILAAQEIQTEL